MSIDDGLFMIYKDGLEHSLNERNVRRSSISNVDKMGIKICGVIDIEHQHILFQSVKSMTTVVTVVVSMGTNITDENIHLILIVVSDVHFDRLQDQILFQVSFISTMTFWIIIIVVILIIIISSHSIT